MELSTQFKLDYDQDDENPLFYFSRFQQYPESLASGLVKRHPLNSILAIGIAYGKGDFSIFL